MVLASQSERVAPATAAPLAGSASEPPRRLPEMQRVVCDIAGQLHSRLPEQCGIGVLDLIQAGHLGLRQFTENPGRAQYGSKSVARFRIRGEMLDMVSRAHIGSKCLFQGTPERKLG